MLRFVFHKIYVGFMPGYLKSYDKQISEIENVCSDCSIFENISAHHKLKKINVILAQYVYLVFTIASDRN